MNADDIRRSLRSQVLGRQIVCLDSVDSTNERAKLLCQQGAEEGTIVIADEQTGGRGRLGRRWHSERGKNLTFSLVITPDLQPGEAGILSLAAALAVAEAVAEATGLRAECKWPNDVLLGGKKCCGILSEAVVVADRAAAVVLGIGLNVNQTSFPPAIGQSATSMMLAAGKPFDRVAVLAAVLAHLETLYSHVRSGETKTILQRWASACPMAGKTIAVDTGKRRITGTVVSFDRDGGMIVRSEGRDNKVFAGDVTIIQS